MAAYRRVYDSRHLQADCQEPGSAPSLQNPTVGNRAWATFTFFTVNGTVHVFVAISLNVAFYLLTVNQRQTWMWQNLIIKRGNNKHRTCHVPSGLVHYNINKNYK